MTESMLTSNPPRDSWLKRIFIRDGRLRSGWRLVSYLLASRLLLILVSIVLGLALAFYFSGQGVPSDQIGARIQGFFAEPAAAPFGVLWFQVVQLAVTFGVVYLWRRWLDRKSFIALGFQLAPGWWQEFLLGAGVIALTWMLIFLFALTTAAISIQAVRLEIAPLVGGLVVGLALNIFVGLNEETDARGYVLQTMSDGLGLPTAVLLSAIYFGALHLLNPGSNAASTLGILLFGILAAVAYWATGRLWMPIGMHAAWNFFEGPVFGFLVSGLNMGGIFDLKVNGAEWLLGGQFGPEAGALTMAPQVVLIAVFILWGRRRQRMTSDK